MFRGLWQWVKDTIYDPILTVFRTQEEVDVILDGKLSEWGTVVDDIDNVPGDAKMRSVVFLDPQDLIEWIKEGGIPSSVVTILKVPDWNTAGDTGYRVFVQDNTP
jgi:hypothetical protein